MKAGILFLFVLKKKPGHYKNHSKNKNKGPPHTSLKNTFYDRATGKEKHYKKKKQIGDAFHK